MADAESVKPAARELVDRLPESASWEDLMYQIYVCEAIDAGLRDADAGRLYRIRPDCVEVLAVVHGRRADLGLPEGSE